MLPLLPLLLQIATGGIISEVILLILVVLVVFVIFKLGRLILGLLVNSLLGLIAFWAVNALFGLGITINLIVIVVVAILGLPGAILIIILKLLGVPV